MPKKSGSSKVTIDVPADQYRLLNQIKNETGKSIRTLVSEGVPLIILEYAEIIEKTKNNAIIEAELMEKTLNEIRTREKK
jgi:hypothetical protein